VSPGERGRPPAVVVGPERAGTAVAFPFLRRLLVALSLLGSLLAASIIVTSWQSYSPLLVVLVAWVVTVSTGPVAVRLVPASGAMTRPGLLGLWTAVLAVDVVVPLTLTPAMRLAPTAWNWGSGAVLICIASAYRRPRDVVALASAHAGVAIAFAVASGDLHPAPLVVAVTGCTVPPLAAAHYLALYTSGLHHRQTAVDRRTRAVAFQASERAQRQSILDRVESIRSSIIELLEHVATDAAIPSDSSVQHQARDLSAALRRELDESRSRGWLITAPARAGSKGKGASRAPMVDVLGPVDLLDDDGRASVAGLVALLGRHTPFMQIVVTVSAQRAGGLPRLEVTVVATGPAAEQAYADPAVEAAIDAMGGSLWYDAEASSLVMEAVVSPGARVEPANPSP
jgi:hypothetical protein